MAEERAGNGFPFCCRPKTRATPVPLMQVQFLCIRTPIFVWTVPTTFTRTQPPTSEVTDVLETPYIRRLPTPSLVVSPSIGVLLRDMLFSCSLSLVVVAIVAMRQLSELQ